MKEALKLSTDRQTWHWTHDSRTGGVERPCAGLRRAWPQACCTALQHTQPRSDQQGGTWRVSKNSDVMRTLPSSWVAGMAGTCSSTSWSSDMPCGSPLALPPAGLPTADCSGCVQLNELESGHKTLAVRQASAPPAAGPATSAVQQALALCPAGLQAAVGAEYWQTAAPQSAPGCSTRGAATSSAEARRLVLLL